MKKIIIIFAIINLLISCDKKNDPQPVQTQATSSTTIPSDPKWIYRYDYKKYGNNTTYTAEECLTPDGMATKQQLISAFNIVQFGRCN